MHSAWPIKSDAGMNVSPRLQVEMMIKKESHSRLAPIQNTETNYLPSLKYKKYPNNSRNDGRSIASTFANVGAQTLSHAIRSRLILKNSYGMPREQTSTFKPVNPCEAKLATLRDYRRDQA